MSLRFIDWIWHIRGSMPLAPHQTGGDALDRLDTLFGQAGTSHDRNGDMLTFRKKDQAAQDKMSVFDNGTLRIEKGAAGSVLHYDLTSRILLFCFLVPLLFIGMAQLTLLLNRLEGSPAKSAAASKKPEPKKAEVPMNPIDKALGAPAPEKPKKDKKDDKKKKPSTTPAYVFASIFAILYVAGRILEMRLVRSLFRRKLLGLQP